MDTIETRTESEQSWDAVLGPVVLHEMEILDSSGHTRTTWDSDKEDEVAAARSQFETLTRKGYKAFRVTRMGGEGEPMKSFDADAEKMILVPPVQGG